MTYIGHLLGACALSVLSACSGGDKCEQAYDKTIRLFDEEWMKPDIAKAYGDGPDGVAKAKADYEAKRGHRLAKCRQGLQDAPENRNKQLDCILGADDETKYRRCGRPWPGD